MIGRWRRRSKAARHVDSFGAKLADHFAGGRILAPNQWHVGERDVSEPADEAKEADMVEIVGK
jgi:hypothetical protein